MLPTMPIERNDRILLALAAVFFVSGAIVGGHGAAMIWLRWTGIGLAGVFAARRGKGTPWIFVAMVAGGELGYDAPVLSLNLKVFSDIFLRLIKTIVAPLILATLVTGIAGHGDLKSVGRMGVKSIVYFEVLTTIALVIGLVAINVSKAGVGLALHDAPGAADTLQKVAPTHWDEFLLHVFPEKHCEECGGGADSAGGGVCGVLRDRAGEFERREAAADDGVCRVADRGDVQVYECGDVHCADRCGRGDGVYGGERRAGCAGEPG